MRISDHGRTVRIFESAGLVVLAGRGRWGTLVIEGQNLGPPDEDGERTEYEYVFVISRRDVRKVLRALHAPANADPLVVLEQRGAEVVRAGESRWLERHGIKADFWARYG